MDIEDFYGQVAGFPPNPLQRAAWQAFWKTQHPALLIRAGTGSGKTEAALLPPLAAGRRVLFVLPFKALLEDLGIRLVRIGRRFSEAFRRPFALTLDMGGSCRRIRCVDGASTELTSHRHLFADDLIVTTLDKFLFRLFGYGEPIKSYIFCHRVFGSTLGKRPFVIFDEAHDYDGLAFSNFSRLLRTLYEKGKDVCVMSATLPAETASFLDPVDALEGDLAEEQRRFELEVLGRTSPQLHLVRRSAPNTAPGERAAFLDVMVQEVERRVRPGRRLIVRTEWIGDLLDLRQRLKDHGPLVYHGRLTMERRRNVIARLRQCQEKDGGFLLLATSAVEAGCDLDAHTVVTELCNPDSLVQLAGRCNRRGRMGDAELVVVGDGVKPQLRTLSQDRHRDYLNTLEAMGASFDSAALRPFFRPPAGDWMGEILFDMLWDYVYNGDLTCKPLWDRGILVTRSWEPPVTLCTGLDSQGLPQNPVQVSLPRLAARVPPEEMEKRPAHEIFSVEENGTWHADLYRAYFDREGAEIRRRTYPLQGRVGAYWTTLFCVLKKPFLDRYFDPSLGYIRLPTVLRRAWKDGFERTLALKPRIKKNGRVDITKNEALLWYLER